MTSTEHSLFVTLMSLSLNLITLLIEDEANGDFDGCHTIGSIFSSLVNLISTPITACDM